MSPRAFPSGGTARGFFHARADGHGPLSYRSHLKQPMCFNSAEGAYEIAWDFMRCIPAVWSAAWSVCGTHRRVERTQRVASHTDPV